jgi:hypothetical protein
VKTGKRRTSTVKWPQGIDKHRVAESSKKQPNTQRLDELYDQTNQVERSAGSP